MADSFLTPARASTDTLALVDERTGSVVASAVELAAKSAERRRGLLGRDGLDSSAALIIAPCSSVHTFFMRFVIDVVFVARDGRVVKIARDLKPWRIAGSLRAYAVVEMAGGGAARSDVRVGDRLMLQQ
jgi:uncharacterized membrane protein (UPF0127 family)